MRLVIATCSVDYEGRLDAHLPLARRLLLVKADGSVSVHADDRAYKPLNWMSPPCALTVEQPDATDIEDGVVERWRVTHAKSGDALLAKPHDFVSVPTQAAGITAGRR